MEVNVHHENYYTQEEFVDGVVQGGWCELTRDKEAVLLVIVTGSTSTETVTHTINVRHRCPATSAPPPINPPVTLTPPSNTMPSEALTKRSSKKKEASRQQQQDYAQFASTEVHDLYRMRCP